MSEMSVLPFEDSNKSSFLMTTIDNVFHFTGDLKASFTMINITDEQYLSDLKSRGFQIFASNQPLDGGVYWLFYIMCDETLEDMYYQNELILDGSKGYFYYRTCKKPLLLQNVGKDNVRPHITTLQRLRFGNQYDLPQIDSVSFNHMDINQLDRMLSPDEVRTVINYQLTQTSYQQPYYLKNSAGEQIIGYTFASMLKNMIDDDIQTISVSNVTDYETELVAVYQGNLCVDFIDGVKTKNIKINNNDYTFGILDLYGVHSNENDSEQRDNSNS